MMDAFEASMLGANPGRLESRPWSTFLAYAGHFYGAVGFTQIAHMADPMSEEEIRHWVDVMFGRSELSSEEQDAVKKRFNRRVAEDIVASSLGGAVGAAGAAALGAPQDLRGRAALGAALGGVIPFFGGPLAALGAYIATKPPSRHRNPVPVAAMIALGVLGAGTMGALTYAGLQLAHERSSQPVLSAPEAA